MKLQGRLYWCSVLTVMLLLSGCFVYEPELIIPDVVGLDKDTAIIRIETSQYTVGLVTESFDLYAASNAVLTQSPAGCTPAYAVTTIDITINRGIELPNYIGYQETVVAGLLANAGLQLGTVTEVYSETVHHGEVMEQSPTGGTMVDVGATVDLTVSLGPERVVVPDVVDTHIQDAGIALINAGLLLGTITEVYDESEPWGLILGQDPGAGLEVVPGSTVDLTMYIGPSPVEVPALYGFPLAIAESFINAVGLSLGATTEVYSTTVAIGAVANQTPAPGNIVVRGATVGLEISLGTRVPDVTHMQEEEAIAALEAAGLEVVLTSAFGLETVGNVLKQSVSPGSLVDPGTQVEICISEGVRVYVDRRNLEAKTVLDGATWATAFAMLQDGVNAAGAVGGGEVWVAQGFYNGPREESDGALIMLDNVSLYGGFTGNETTRDNRELEFNVSIISGEEAFLSEFGVPDIILASKNMTVDGFKIENLNRPEILELRPNSAIKIVERATRVTIRNCLFEDLHSTFNGIFDVEEVDHQFTIEACVFKNNYSNPGYLIDVGDDALTLDISDSIFTGNLAVAGALVSTHSTEANISDCIFAGNGYDVVASNSSSNTTIQDCVFTNNYAFGISAGQNGQFLNCIFNRNTGLDLMLLGQNGVLQNCAFIGNGRSIFPSGRTRSIVRNAGGGHLINNAFIGNIITENTNAGVFLRLPYGAATYMANCTFADTQ